MKRLFGREKPKIVKPTQGSKEWAEEAVRAPPTEQRGVQSHIRRSSSEDRWDVVSSSDSDPLHRAVVQSPSLTSLPSSHSPHLPSSQTPRAVSPFASSGTSHKSKDRERDQILRKKPPNAPNPVAALGILRALDPHPDPPLHQPKDISVEEPIDCPSREREEKKERRPFWDRREKDKDRDKDKDKNHIKDKDKKEDDSQAELTRMIGYLTATSSEDWSLVLEVCERASANEVNAKEAVKALRREFKYAEPTAQLSAARLWAIMLRNSNDVFINQCTSRKFLDTIEDVLTNPRTSPVIRERLLDVVAAAAYSGGQVHDGKNHDKDGFRGLWRKVKPPEKPDEGIPFDMDDSMFNPHIPNSSPYISSVPGTPRIEPSSLDPQQLLTSSVTSHKHKHRNRVIPPEEDMRRLLQECKVGRGNAALLSEALAFAKPEDLKQKDIIREFYARCRASQELVYAQIPWASAGAERSRQQAAAARQEQDPRKDSRTSHERGRGRQDSVTEAVELTPEEELLAALLGANEDLLEALRLYDDLERVGIERDAEERSRKETRIDRTRLQYDYNGNLLEPPQFDYGASSSRSPSPSPSPSPTPSLHQQPPPSIIPSVIPSITHPLPPIPLAVQGHGNANSNTHTGHGLATPTLHSLAPPPPAPHGPRSPAPPRSRTPSPEPPLAGSFASSTDTNRDRNRGTDHGHDVAAGKLRTDDWEHVSVEGDMRTPVKPSAKALGKRRVIDTADPHDTNYTDDLFYEHTEEPPHLDDYDSDSSEGRPNPWHHHVQYVYDAAAERTRQRITESRLATAAEVVGSVH